MIRPAPLLIVATGGEVYVRNARLNTVDRYDLSDTPLGLLLNDNVNLKTNSAITGVDDQRWRWWSSCPHQQQPQQGNITLVFSSPQLELRQWTVKDNQGGTTMVALHDPVSGAALDETLFAAPVKSPAGQAIDRCRWSAFFATAKTGTAWPMHRGRRRICRRGTRWRWTRCRC